MNSIHSTESSAFITAGARSLLPLNLRRHPAVVLGFRTCSRRCLGVSHCTDHCSLHHRCEYCSDFIFEGTIEIVQRRSTHSWNPRAIGDRTHPHAPLKDSATLITRYSPPPRAGAWSADVIISTMLALAASASTNLLTARTGQSINDYYDQLRFIWDQIDLSDPTWACSKDAQQYASIRDEFRLYEFLMSLHKDFEPIRGQLLNRSPAPSLDTAVNELVREEARLATLQAQNKLNQSSQADQQKFCNYCKRPGHTIETCYRRNKSTAAVANTEPTPPTASTSVESQSSGSTINLSSTELQEIIAQAVRMAGNASLSTALSVLPGKSQTWLFDSACCNHMTPHSSLFSNLDPAPHPLNIHIADGSTMHGNSLGFVSTSNLSDPRTGQELGTGPRVGRMFPVNNLHLPPVAPVSVAAAAAAVSSLPSLALWHSRLGHAPSSRLGKQPALPFNNSESISNSIFELIHSDVWGPSPVASIGTSQQNGRAERKLRHILDTVRALLLSAKVPAPFWGEAVFMLFMQLTAFQVLSSIIRLRMSVSLGHPLTIITFAHLDLLVSFFFSLMSTTNLSLDLDSVVSLVMAKLKRDESLVPSTNTFDPPLDFSPDIFDASPRQVADEQIDDELPHFEPGSPAPALPEDPPQDIPPRHSTRVRSIPPHLLDYHCYTALATLHEPQTYREASTDPLWQIAMKEELDALTKNHTWDLVTLPPGQSVVGCKWIYKIKTRSDGSVERYKARLVAKGFTQEYGIDYEETFAPVARISSVRALLAVAAARKWDLFQMDVKNAFLNGDLSEEVYMQPPPGLSVESNKVCHLRRALYGLKQAPRAWFAKFSSTIFRLGYTASPYDSALFLRRTDKGTILLLLYVDDMIITGDDLSGIQELKDFLSQQFEMKDLGHLSYFLGLEITHSTDGLYITQAKRLVGSLVYLTVTRPDISYVVHQVSQYLSAPRSTHYAAVLRILRYLKGTLFHGLFYSAQSPLVLRAFSDADWAGDPTDRRSTTGYCFLLGSSLISWRSKKQTFVARSSTEAEYRALADTTSELLWLRWLLKDLGVSTSSATPLYCDNQSAIHIAHNDVFHERTKHIEIDCHFIRYHLVHGALKLFSVSSKDQLADIFTKSLPKRRTRDLVDNLKLVGARGQIRMAESVVFFAVERMGDLLIQNAVSFKAVHNWFSEIQNAAYDAEDVHLEYRDNAQALYLYVEAKKI
ncbi:Retrovirus-related Pol polyprotein from transposon RE1 [Vitis vinifera]|uniref:Retrovirus-related Pol polyprotein from transposon RE1 n=1 Tax=Vitis vinifera TaxID=29760 RepID=A0A438I8Z6_VITVI|nr:Retrovirus-related Pol polyprotein from transposon RE1 [Vitis vinifera]